MLFASPRLRGEAGLHRRCNPGEGVLPRVTCPRERRSFNASLRAQRSNPEFLRGKTWIASRRSQ
ncbi:hypothetical protein DXU04_11585 [Bradyrhizobium diazoefficiens]